MSGRTSKDSSGLFEQPTTGAVNWLEFLRFSVIQFAVGPLLVSRQIQKFTVGGMIPLLSLSLLIFAISTESQGAEPVAVAGIVEQAPPTGGQFATTSCVPNARVAEGRFAFPTSGEKP